MATISSRAKILPSTELLDTLTNEVRDISVTVEILWDDITWTDESEYVVSVQADEQMDDTIAEAIASTADIVLSNTTNRFLPENPDSEIKDYLIPHKQIRISITTEGITYRMFTGYIKSIVPERQNGTVTLSCFDNAEKILYYECPREAYSNQKAHDLIRILALNGGMEEEELELDYSSHEVTAAWFEETKTWEAMGLIAAAERGRVFFNRNGNLRFWNREYIQNQESVMKLTGLDHIISMDAGVSSENIVNYVTVTATPREANGLQVVWTNGNILIMDPYSDPLIWIPAGDQQSAWVEIDDPAIDWTQPVANTDYTANTAADGSGTDLTSSVQILDWRTYGNSAYITVKNNSSSDMYLTKFEVRANPLPISKWIKVRQIDQTSIDRYGEQKREIENNYIDDETMAANIAETELKRWKNATSALELQTIGLPFLQVGDVVKVEISKSVSETVDQYQATAESNQEIGTTSTVYLAQSFTPQYPYLSRVLIRPKKPNAGTFTGGIELSIQENSAGVPSGTKLASTSIDPAQWNSLGDNINYSVLLPFTPDVNKKYFLVFQCSTSDDTNYAYLKKSTTTDLYPNGELLSSADGNAWVSVGANHDIYFQWYGYKGQLEDKLIQSINWSVTPNGGYVQTMTLIEPVLFPTYYTVTSKANIFNTTERTIWSKASIVPPETKTKFVTTRAKIAEW